MRTSAFDRPAAAILATFLRRGLGTRSAVLLVQQPVAFDAATGGSTPGPELQYPVQALPGEEYAASSGMDVGTLTQRGEQVWMLPGTIPTPDTSMRLRISGADWAISEVRALSSGELNVIWLVVVGGAV